MIATHRTPPVYKSDLDTLQVCAWCWPNRSLDLFFPELSRMKIKINHTMCPSCLGRTLHASLGIPPEPTR